VRRESGPDVFGCVVEHQGVDEPVAATVGNVSVREAMAEQVVDVVA
jgi:hypothetical protein